MHDKYVRRRRVLLGTLVATSLILLTAYFGEAQNSPLHSIQRGIVEIFTPIQDGASKVLSPLRDLTGWISSTLHAKSEVPELRSQLAQAHTRSAKYNYVMAQNAEYLKLLKLDNRLNISQYAPVNAYITVIDPELFYDDITVDRGSGDGVKDGDPVICSEGLVGVVSSVGDNYAVVSELTSPKFGAEARIEDGASSPVGTLLPEIGDPTNLQVQYLDQNAQNEQISDGDEVVTAGTSEKQYPSLFPPGIPIGVVTNFDVNTLIDDGTVDVSPFVDVRTISTVQILTRVTA